MGRLNWLVLSLVGESEHLVHAAELAETGDYDRPFVAQLGHDAAFTETHFFRADEFEALLEAGGVTVETLVGLEGLASVLAAAPLRGTADELSAHQRAGVQALVDELRTDRTAVDMPHTCLPSAGRESATRTVECVLVGTRASGGRFDWAACLSDGPSTQWVTEHATPARF